MRRKRIADILEKMSVAFFVGAYFQKGPESSPWWPIFFAAAAFTMCMILTRREA